MQEFTGLHEDMYRFFWELAFQNNVEFFEQNRKRYEQEVKIPLYALTAQLLPTALKIDPQFDTRISVCVSRIRRDTRYSKDKSPFRDHAWIGFRYRGQSVSEGFVPYIEFNRDSYGYGMGMYAPDTARMADIRNRILARPKQFLKLIHDRKFDERFTLDADAYKRPKFSHENPEIAQYLNLRRIAYSFTSSDLKRTTRPEILDECKEALELLAPLYAFLI